MTLTYIVLFYDKLSYFLIGKYFIKIFKMLMLNNIIKKQKIIKNFTKLKKNIFVVVIVNKQK